MSPWIYQLRASRTGIVYNVTPRAVGIIINKIVGNRYIEKRVNVRIEHIKHSKCRQEFLDRVKRNTAASAEAKKSGGALVCTHVSRGALLTLMFQNASPSSVCRRCRVPVVPSLRRKTLPRRLSLFVTRPPSDICTSTVRMQSNRMRLFWVESAGAFGRSSQRQADCGPIRACCPSCLLHLFAQVFRPLHIRRASALDCLAQLSRVKNVRLLSPLFGHGLPRA